MIRKNTLALIIVISVLMFNIGCDGDGSGSSTDGGSGTEGCANCPCDFFSVPMTTECWVIDSDQPAFAPFPPSPGTEFDSCRISIPSVIDGGAFITDDFFSAELSCSILGLDATNCPSPDESQSGLTQAQFADCLTCLEQYATELNNTGITVTGGPPYSCVPDDACLGCWDY